MEFFKVLTIVMAICWLPACSWHGVPYSYSAYRAGKAEAARHLADTGIAAMTMGLPIGESETEKILKTKYRISTVLVPTCMPTDSDIGRLKGFNEVMAKAAKDKFGSDVITEAFGR